MLRFLNPSSPPAESGTVARRLLIDLMIAVTLLAGSGVWATRFWTSWTARGGKAQFYQHYFEPAVMVACGKGFVVSQRPDRTALGLGQPAGQEPKSLADFLFGQVDTFDCRDIPSDLKLGREQLYQHAWIYLLTTVGWAWRVVGISWSRLGPLFGLFFGIVIALAYAIFRLGMGRPLAAFCVFGFAISSTHLLNLPHLRDYAKAPFTLALMFILGLIVTLPVRRWTLLALAVSYGAVLGIGYGFRTDLLANLPILPIVLWAFVDGGVTRHLRLKAAASVLFLATFIIVSWPVSSAVYTKGGCQWHVTLLGLQSPFDDVLRVAPAPYDFGHIFADSYISHTTDGYARRMRPDAAPLGYCTHEYDVQSGRYLQAILVTFPADLIVRAYASTLQIVELPFVVSWPRTPGWATWLYGQRADMLKLMYGWGLYVFAAALLLTSAVSLRLGIFLLFVTAYFGGYPAIQFQERHYFHLEVMGWWALGFVIHQTIQAAWSLRLQDAAVVKAIRGGLLRAGAFGLSAVVLVVAVLGAARWYQERQASRLLHAYIEAPKVPLRAPYNPLKDVGPLDRPQYMEVDLNEAACGAKPAVTFRYGSDPTLDFSRTITIAHRAAVAGTTRIFVPVFEGFRGLELSDTRPGCFVGASRFTNTTSVPLLLGATLPPGWEALPLYQRLKNWERDPAP